MHQSLRLFPACKWTKQLYVCFFLSSGVCSGYEARCLYVFFLHVSALAHLWVRRTHLDDRERQQQQYPCLILEQSGSLKCFCLFSRRSLPPCFIGGEGCYRQTTRIPHLPTRICLFIIHRHLNCAWSHCAPLVWLIGVYTWMYLYTYLRELCRETLGKLFDSYGKHITNARVGRVDVFGYSAVS